MAGGSLDLLDADAFLGRGRAAIQQLARGEGSDRIYELGERIAEDASSHAPVSQDPSAEPGKLAASIEARRNDDGSTEVGSFGVSYARYVEHGTSKMAAEPFLRPALHSNRL